MLKVDRRLLSDQVYDELLQRIIRGQYAPGSRINVDAIADELQVSRTPVREAVTKLSWTHFVNVERNARTMVAQWTVTDMQHRLVVAGRVASLMAADPSLSLNDLAQAFDGADDVAAYLDGLEQLIARASNRVAAHTVADHVTPLRIFFGVARSVYGIECDGSLAHRRSCLQILQLACRRDDRNAAVAALNSYLAVLSESLERQDLRRTA